MSDIELKVQRLREHIRGFGSALIAFSGGVDSSLVAFVAAQELGSRALAVTSGSRSLKREDLALCRALAAEWGLAHLVIETAEMENPNYAANPANRCYYCKSTLYEDLRSIARDRGIAVVLNGTNLDDRGDHRPGLAAAADYAVRSPLEECGMHKADVRAAAALLALKNAAKPQAACLASRVPYGTPVSLELLARIERAETALAAMGFSQCRVRHHGTVARIELPVEDLALAVEHHAALSAAVRDCGYTYVALDLEGFRSGSMNAALRRGRHIPIREATS